MSIKPKNLAIFAIAAVILGAGLGGVAWWRSDAQVFKRFCGVSLPHASYRLDRQRSLAVFSIRERFRKIFSGERESDQVLYCRIELSLAETESLVSKLNMTEVWGEDYPLPEYANVVVPGVFKSCVPEWWADIPKPSEYDRHWINSNAVDLHVTGVWHSGRLWLWSVKNL